MDWGDVLDFVGGRIGWEGGGGEGGSKDHVM